MNTKSYVTNTQLLYEILQVSRQIQKINNKIDEITAADIIEEEEEEWDGNSPYCSDTHNEDSEEECTRQKGTFHRHKLQRTQKQLWPSLINDSEVEHSNPRSKECQKQSHSNFEEAFKED